MGPGSAARDAGKLRVEGKEYEVARRRCPRDPLQRLSPRRPGRSLSATGPVAADGEGRLVIVATPSATWATCPPGPSRPWPAAAYIYCEDTRRTLKLLSHASIAGPRLVAHHRFNEAASTATAVERLKAGATIALVTDAGTPW